MKNKKAMGAAIWVLVGLVALLVVGGGVYMFSTPEAQVIVTQPSELAGTGCADSTGILTMNDYSALDSGTDPGTPTYTAGTDGGVITTTVTSGTTEFPIGAKIIVLSSISNYIDKSFSFTMPCGGKVLDVPMYYSTNDNPSIKIKNDDDNFMTDNISGGLLGGGVNQSALTAGETFNLEVEFQGTNGEASGDGLYVIEFPANSGANITSVTIAGLESVPVPSVHTSQNAGSQIAAFKVPSIVGAEKKTYVLSIALAATKTLVGGVYTDWYTMQEFVDDDKTISYGVEDASGDGKYENADDSDFYVEDA